VENVEPGSAQQRCGTNGSDHGGNDYSDVTSTDSDSNDDHDGRSHCSLTTPEIEPAAQTPAQVLSKVAACSSLQPRVAVMGMSPGTIARYCNNDRSTTTAVSDNESPSAAAQPFAPTEVDRYIDEDPTTEEMAAAAEALCGANLE